MVFDTIIRTHLNRLLGAINRAPTDQLPDYCVEVQVYPAAFSPVTSAMTCSSLTFVLIVAWPMKKTIAPTPTGASALKMVWVLALFPAH
jgi:hypothetical protein